jgi:imidazolonepropionase-like amidohydrolase
VLFAGILALGIPGGSLLAGAILGREALAQPGRPPVLAIRGARVHTLTGPPLEGATVLVRRGEIVAVGTDVQIPRGSSILEAEGMELTPGLIDAWSGSLVGDGAPQDRGATSDARAADAVDPFLADEIQELLQGGITTLHVDYGYPSGFGCRGAVVRLVKGSAGSDFLRVPEASLTSSLGVSTAQPLLRLGELKGLRSDLIAARKYKESWEEYDEALEEYMEKIEERKKKDEAEDKKEGQTTDPGKPGDDKPGDAPEKDKPEDEPKGERRRRPHASHVEDPVVGEEDLQRPRRRPRPEAPPPEETTEEPKSDKKTEGDLDKPIRPRKDPRLELIVQLLEGKMPLRVEAHRAEDVLNAIALAKEHKLRLQLVGCSEGYRIAKDIAERHVPVILGPTLESILPRRDALRFHRPGTAARLHEAGATVVLGTSSHVAGGSRFLRANAALAVSHGLDRDAALRAITVEAARVLGLDDRLGTIEKGKDADLVLFRGDPLDPRAAVEVVIVGGEVVYRKEEAGR